MIRSNSTRPSWYPAAQRSPRFDHGSEFIAQAVAETAFIEPGSPWQNAWIESFNGRARDELLNGERFDIGLEAKVVVSDWRIEYKTNRPHSALGTESHARMALRCSREQAV